MMLAIWMYQRNAIKMLPLSEKECMCRKKHSIYGICYYLWLQASTKGFGTYSPVGKGRLVYMTVYYPSGRPLANERNGLQWKASLLASSHQL